MQKDKETKKAIVLTIVFALVVGALIMLVMQFMKNPDEASPANTMSTVEISVDDSNKIKEALTEFVVKSTNFGFDLSQINENNIYTVSNEGRNSILNYSRDKAFEEVSRFIELEGPLSNTLKNYQGLDDNSYNSDLIAQFSGTNVSIPEVERGYENDGVLYSKVLVTFDSKVERFAATGSDTDWDGTYDKYVKTKPSVELNITMSKKNDEWYVHDLTTFDAYSVAIFPIDNNNYSSITDGQAVESTLKSKELEEFLSNR